MKQIVNTLQKGFTVIEMLLYMAIFSLLLIILMQIFFSALDVQSESKTTSSVDQDGTYIIGRLSYDIQRAQAVIVPASYGVAGNTLEIQINGINYTYSVDGNSNLILTNDQGTNQLNTPDTTVTNVQFIRVGTTGGKSTSQISFKIISTAKRTSGAESRSYITTISLR